MYNVMDYGTVADGITNTTAAFQKTIDKCSENGGGVVFIPFGKYVLGSVHLHSNVHIVFESGATLLGSLDPDDFDDREKLNYPLYQDASHSFFHRSMFWAEDCENISFSGNGIIDMRDVWEKEPHQTINGETITRAAKIIAIKNSKNIVIKELNLYHATDLGVYLAGCENVRITQLQMDVRIDAISPDCCKNVTISDCNIKSGDDAIVLKSSYALNEKRLCENITVTNCTITSRYCAIKLGTETNGGFKNIAISNCSIYDTCGSGIALEITDGGELDGVTVSNIVMNNVATPLFIILSDRARGPEGTQIGSVKNIIVDNIIANGPYHKVDAIRNNYQRSGEGMMEINPLASSVTGQPYKKVENITLSNFYITVPGGGTKKEKNIVLPEITKIAPSNSYFGDRFPCYGIFFRHAKNVKLSNINIMTIEDDERDVYFFEDVENIIQN
ncbi:MAG: right-handed parallel beta-helix repeat-containing protein [Clostridia bacterium]|nr:right-handed parallel beta-helix repeat-containing protein [Clostridia bacterium]